MEEANGDYELLKAHGLKNESQATTKNFAVMI